LREAGINLVFISGSKGLYAQDFIDQFKITSPVWVDPKLVTYKLLGFNRSRLSVLLDPRGAPNAARALARGFMQGRTAGDPNQHGGVVVVRRGGAVVYAYGSKVAGDMPPMDEVLAKAREAATG
jgi:hypothetical protein